MPLIWEKVPTYLAPEHDGHIPHPSTPFYRLKVPGGWLLREQSVHPGGHRGPVPTISGPLFFLPDPTHAWRIGKLTQKRAAAKPREEP